MPTHFKLKLDNLTRRTLFKSQPNWQELSEKISALYSIPQDLVAVTYIDSDNEEITLNTEEELQDYYQSSYLPGEPIKFTVQNLSSRDQRPSPSNVRNTFGQFVHLDVPGVDEWQSVNNIPSLDEILGMASPSSQAHSAFVESVSEGSTVTKGNGAKVFDGEDGDAVSQISRIPSEGKGKGRAASVISLSSARSVLAEDDSEKPPVHVYDVSSQNRSSVPPVFSPGKTIPPIAAESTPRAHPLTLDDRRPFVSENEPLPEVKPEEHDDPPLPTFDSTSHHAQPSVNLARDVAAFLNLITGIVTSHPELGEALRTIAQKTTNGTYWTAHREALSQAAAEFQRSTEALAEEGRRVVEEESGRKVAEALAGVLRIFSQAAAQPPPTENTQPTNTNDANPRARTPHIPGAFPPDFHPPHGGNYPYNPRYTWRAPSSLPPNLAPGWWTMPPRPPPFGFGVLNATGPPLASQATQAPNVSATASVLNPEPTTQPAQLDTEASIDNQVDEPLSPQELKAKVEEAKRAYKLEKERYRQQRDERKKEKERTLGKADTSNVLENPNMSTFPDDSHIVSNARNGFPQFEMVHVPGSLPKRHNTHPGHFSRRLEKSAGDLFTRAVSRISRRLSDMGFTDQAYPDLPEKIKAQLPNDGAVTKDREDDIVTTLLEGMLAAPRTPVASGSGLKDKDIPGSWH